MVAARQSSICRANSIPACVSGDAESVVVIHAPKTPQLRVRVLERNQSIHMMRQLLAEINSSSLQAGAESVLTLAFSFTRLSAETWRRDTGHSRASSNLTEPDGARSRDISSWDFLKKVTELSTGSGV